MTCLLLLQSGRAIVDLLCLICVGAMMMMHIAMSHWPCKVFQNMLRTLKPAGQGCMLSPICTAANAFHVHTGSSQDR